MQTPNPMLQARALTKSFGGFVAVNDVNFSVSEGTIHALIGPNGAGKSTLFNLLTKFLPPTSGQIFFEGKDITPLNPAQISRRGMARSFQISSVFPHLSVLENVRIALQAKHSDTYSFWRPDRTLKRLDAESMALLESVGLADLAHKVAVELSYGRKRALELATTIALDPRIILLDEPMAGMGREDISRTAELIRKLGAAHTVVMVEHNLSVVADLSDIITVLRRGEVIAEGSYELVSNDKEVQRAYLGGVHA